MNENLQKLLNMHNVTIYKLSKDTEIPYSTLSDWNKNKTSLSPEKIAKVADYFGVSVDYLLGRDKEMELRIQFKSEKEASLYLDIMSSLETMSIDKMKEASRYLKYLAAFNELRQQNTSTENENNNN